MRTLAEVLLIRCQMWGHRAPGGIGLYNWQDFDPLCSRCQRRARIAKAAGAEVGT